MDGQTIITAISSLGFPIVAAAALFWFVKYIMDSNQRSMDRLFDEQSKRTDDIKSSLDNNTRVLEKVVDQLSRLDKD